MVSISKDEISKNIGDVPLTKIQGVPDSRGYINNLKISGCVDSKIENHMYFAVIMLLLHKYTQDKMINVICGENNENEQRLSIYSVDFHEVETFRDILIQCKLNRMILKKTTSNSLDNNEFAKSLKKQIGTIPLYVGIFEGEICDLGLGCVPDVELLIVKDSNSINLEIRAKKCRFSNILNHFCNIAKNVAENIDISINGINMLSQKEVHTQLVEWNNSERIFDSAFCLHELIERNALKYPNQQAIIFQENSETYSSLNEKANQLVRYILENYKLYNKVIAIHMEKNIDLVICILAVLKLGCAFLPIDSKYPRERISYMLNDSKTNLILTQSKLKKNIEALDNIEMICIDEENNTIKEFEKNNININVTSKDIAYVIYTSGSTGDPKGVVLNHLGRVNNFSDFNLRFNIGTKDKILAVSSLSFDMCAYDIIGTLMAGATIVLPNSDMSLQSFHWLTLIDKYQITIWHSVPTLLEMLCKSKSVRRNKSISSLRVVLLGGDWISTTLPERFRKYNSEAILISLGGATEASMDSFIYKIDNVNDEWVSIPYGKPMYNQKAYILSDKMELLPQGAIGQLYIGGIGVADGYYNRKELTDERFIDYKYAGIQDRIYKTGDLARYLEDGCIQLIGRCDFQVKIDGLRIELGEIEKKIKQFEGIEDAICLAITNEQGKKKIVAFLIVNSEIRHELPGEGFLKEELKKSLVSKSIPEKFIFTSRFPVTPNGKVDRKEMERIAMDEL